MNEPRFSLCIPTMDRFDTFLRDNLKRYFVFKEVEILDEIIVVDENGNDYEKIKKEFPNQEGLHVYKNEEILGVFKNKIRAASYAKTGNFIAVIDSDNFADEHYFRTVKDFIIQKKLTTDIPMALAPTFAKPKYDYRYYSGYLINAETAFNLFHQNTMVTFLNTANFVITKCVDEQVVCPEESLSQLHFIDVLYKHVLAFQQIPDYRIYAVPGLEYEHTIHDDSYFVKHVDDEQLKLNLQYCLNILREIVASYKK
jgi:Glycosyl transferase family 2